MGGPLCRGVSRTIARAVGGRDGSGLRPVLVFVCWGVVAVWLLFLWVWCVASVFVVCQDSSGRSDHRLTEAAPAKKIGLPQHARPAPKLQSAWGQSGVQRCELKSVSETLGLPGPPMTNEI